MKKNRKILALLLLVVIAVLVFISTQAFNVIEETTHKREYANFVKEYAGIYGVDEDLIFAVINTESGFDKDAVSEADAYGLMQITEITFDWIKSKIARDEDLVFEDLFDPETNIRFGTYLMSYCLERYSGDIATSAAAYHSGIGLVDDLLTYEEYSSDGIVLSVFPYEQMNNYVYKIENNYEWYKNNPA